MKLKWILGIVIPLIIVLLLVVLSALNIGFSATTKTVASVSAQSILIGNGSERAPVLIQTIEIKNDFFLPRKYELPRVIACLHDKDGEKRIMDLSVSYSEGRRTTDRKFEDSFLSYNSYGRQTINVDAQSEKQVKIFVNPIYPSYDDLSKEEYKKYDEIILINPENSYYYSCYNLGEFVNKTIIPFT